MKTEIFTLFTEMIINIVYRNAEIKKIQTEIRQRKTIFNRSWTVTKVANELSSWSLSHVDISWLSPHVKCN